MARLVRLPSAEREFALRCLRHCKKYSYPGMDKSIACGVCFVDIPVGAAPGGSDAFPRGWKRKEGAQTNKRGDALWCIPKDGDPSRRMLYLHGGGFTSMAPQDEPYRALVSQLAKLTGLTILAIDYRLSPEYKCPAAVEDGIAALKWLAKHGPPTIGSGVASEAVASEIFIAGDSAGGGLTFAVGLEAKGKTKSLIRGLIGISPWTDLTCSTSAYSTRAWDPKTRTGDPFDGPDDNWHAATAYVGTGRHAFPRTDLRASPFLSPLRRLKNLAPSLFLVGDYELALGDAVDMQAKMVAAGHSDASVSTYEGMFHIWVMYSDGKGLGESLPAGNRGLKEIARWIAERSL